MVAARLMIDEIHLPWLLHQNLEAKLALPSQSLCVCKKAELLEAEYRLTIAVSSCCIHHLGFHYSLPLCQQICAGVAESLCGRSAQALPSFCGSIGLRLLPSIVGRWGLGFLLCGCCADAVAILISSDPAVASPRAAVAASRAAVFA